MFYFYNIVFCLNQQNYQEVLQIFDEEWSPVVLVHVDVRIVADGLQVKVRNLHLDKFYQLMSHFRTDQIS